MASDANIEAAISNYGSSACWTIPGTVEWSQNTAAAPTLSPAEAAALRAEHLGQPVSTAIESEASAEVSAADKAQHVGSAAVRSNSGTSAAA